MTELEKLKSLTNEELKNIVSTYLDSTKEEEIYEEDVNFWSVNNKIQNEEVGNERDNG